MNRKPSAVSASYAFHQRRGVDLRALLVAWSARLTWQVVVTVVGALEFSADAWYPDAGRKHLPATVDERQVAGALRIGEALWLRHNDIDVARGW